MEESKITKTHNKRKILNDPVYGFITIPYNIIFDLIEHRHFQRLRRIKQVGMSNLVYPGANHTRFHHALGAMHLMQLAIASLREKEVEISNEEAEASLIAILLHDIGHGPYSHSLEYTLIKGVSHEKISDILMKELNKEFKGALSLGIKIFENKYKKPFLHQLVSSQLDMDRLDYLSRDSFYTGVSEGVISNHRIIKMLNVVDGDLVVEEKGIYSIEKFIIARRLMYWQVYLHKTVVSSERLLISILKRAIFCVQKGMELFASPALKFFLRGNFTEQDFDKNRDVLDQFVLLDDADIIGAIKVWCTHPDPILSDLCKRLVHRRLFRVVINDDAFDENLTEQLRNETREIFNLNEEEIEYYFQTGVLENNAYNLKIDGIGILKKNGRVEDIVKASDNGSMMAQAEAVKKYMIYLPKEVKNFS